MSAEERVHCDKRITHLMRSSCKSLVPRYLQARRSVNMCPTFPPPPRLQLTVRRCRCLQRLKSQ